MTDTRTTGESEADATAPRRAWRRPAVLVPAAVLGLVVAGVALVAFAPWKLVLDDVVDEALPSVASSPSTAASASSAPSVAASGEPAAATSPAAVAAAPRVVSRGTFINHEHSTSGSVALLELPDGSQVLRLENLDTSNGPDLKVWITDAPVIDGPSGWRVFDDGQYLDLGSLKGNKGNQNYDVPLGASLAGLTSVSIWCDRFDVSFGAATLAAV